MGRKSTKKIEGHADLEPGELVIDACYGLGKGVLRAADLVSPRASYSEDADAMTSDPAGSMGARLDRTGIIALTDRRLLFLPVKTVITKPKAVAAAYPLADVLGAGHERDMLAIRFADGSVGGLHVPGAEKPADFVATLNAQVAPGS